MEVVARTQLLRLRPSILWALWKDKRPSPQREAWGSRVGAKGRCSRQMTHLSLLFLDPLLGPSGSHQPPALGTSHCRLGRRPPAGGELRFNQIAQPQLSHLCKGNLAGSRPALKQDNVLGLSVGAPSHRLELLVLEGHVRTQEAARMGFDRRGRMLMKGGRTRGQLLCHLTGSRASPIAIHEMELPAWVISRANVLRPVGHP